MTKSDKKTAKTVKGDKKTAKKTLGKFNPDNTVKRKEMRAKIKGKDTEVRQLKYNSWNSDAVEKLFVDAKQVVDENEYTSLTKLWKEFGLSSQVIADLLERYPEHAYIYQFIKTVVESYLWEAAASGTLHSNLALFALRVNYGWIDPKIEAEKEDKKVTLNISEKLSKLLEEND